jgi:hypothetical protein
MDEMKYEKYECKPGEFLSNDRILVWFHSGSGWATYDIEDQQVYKFATKDWPAAKEALDNLLAAMPCAFEDPEVRLSRLEQRLSDLEGLRLHPMIINVSGKLDGADREAIASAVEESFFRRARAGQFLHW